MGKAKNVASGALWSVLYNVLNVMYGFVAVPLLINYFGKAEYGLISIAQSVNIYIQLLDWGFNSTNVRFFSVWLEGGNFQRVSKLFKTSLALYGLIGILNAVILIAVALCSAYIFNTTPEQDAILKQLLYILAAAAIFNWTSSSFDQIIRATENVAWIQKRSFFPKILQILFLFFTIWFNWSITFYFFMTTFALFVILPLSYKKIKKELPFVSFAPRFDLPILKEIIPYTWNILLFNFFKFTFINLCPVFIGIRLSMEVVTDYKVIHTIASLPAMVTGVVLGALLPSAAKVVSHGTVESYRKIAYKGTKYLSMAVCFCVFGLMAIEKDLLVIYVGESFLHLINWLYILSFISLTNHILCISSLILSGTDIKALTKMTGISSLSSIVFAWVMLPRLSIGGVVIAQVLYEIFQMAFYYLYYMPLKMKLSSKKILQEFLPSFFIGVVSFMAVSFIPCTANSWANVFIFAIVFSIIYLLVSYFVLEKDDRDYLKSIIANV